MTKYQVAGSCPGMTSGDRDFIPNGNISTTSEAELPLWKLPTLIDHRMEKAGHHDTQLASTVDTETTANRSLSSYMYSF